MSFLHPGWFLLLLILPIILLGAILAHRSRNKAWQRIVAPRLRKQLVREGSSTRRWISLSFGLLGCALLIATLTRPYQGETTTTETISSRNILIAVDTSRSMLVRDGSPDRMTTAKAMALELITAFPNDRIGIIAFSGVPVLMAPLTIDHTSVHETISQLDTRVIPSGGSDLPSAVKLAIKTFQKTGQKSNALIIISDGEDHSQQATLAAREIRDSSIAVCTIGVGSSAGGIIPDPQRSDGKYRDHQGHTVHSQMIPDALDQLARAGGGSFVPASSGADTAIHSALTFLKSNQQQGRQISIPTEKYQWWLFPAILLLVISQVVRSHLFSPKIPAPSAVIAAIILLGFSQDIHAATHIEQATSAYKSKDYKTALDLFHKALEKTHGEDRHPIQFSQGNSAYHLKQWDNAIHYFSRSLLAENPHLQEESHYNLGNSLFQSAWSQFKPAEETQQPKTTPQETFIVKDLAGAISQIKDAITHYQAALAINSQNKSATHNLAEAQKLLKQLQEKSQQTKDKKNDSKKPQEKGESDQPKKGDGKKDDGNDPKDDPKNNGQNDPKNDPNSGDKNTPSPNKKTQDASQKDKQDMKQKSGETKEAFAARILKENSDAETRPITRRLLRLRPPTKDW